MRIEIFKHPFDPWQEVAHHAESRTNLRTGAGATAVFVGTMRDFNEGDTVTGMTLEYYPGMTESHLEKICREAEQRWDVRDMLIIHRVGDLRPGDAIVLVAVWAAHRASAYDANRYIMEYLKSEAPFWKKETVAGGTRWVERNTPG